MSTRKREVFSLRTRAQHIVIELERDRDNPTTYHVNTYEVRGASEIPLASAMVSTHPAAIGQYREQVHRMVDALLRDEAWNLVGHSL